MALWGIDISSYQAGITQATVSNTDVLVIKATEGTGYVNPYFQAQFDTGVAAGKKVGVYHFWRAGDGTAQADYFLDTVGANQPDFYVLDFEDASEADNESGALAFLRRVKERTGSTPWLYTYGSQLVANQYSSIGDEGYPLWLAWYYYSSADGFGTDKDLSFMTSYWGLTGWNIAGWQYTDNGYLPGWSAGLDFNLFNEEVFGGAASSTAVEPWAYPVDENVYTITQTFSQDLTDVNYGTAHGAIDFATPVGTPVKAMGSGVVLWADWTANLPQTSWEARWYLGDGSFGGAASNGGITVLIDHGSVISGYSHLSKTDLNAGDTVTAGQVIGESGATGYVQGAHLHFFCMADPPNYQNGYYGCIDPAQVIQEHNSAVTAAALSQKDWFDMATLEDLKQAIREVREEPFVREGGRAQKKFGTKTTSEGAVIRWMDENLLALNEKLDKISSRQDIIWGGIFTDFSYSGKEGTNEPGAIKLLKSLATKTSGLDEKLSTLGAVASTGGTVTTASVSAVTGIGEDKLREIISSELGKLALVKGK